MTIHYGDNMGIPMELLSMGASTVLGGILGIMAQASKDKA